MCFYKFFKYIFSFHRPIFWMYFSNSNKYKYLHKPFRNQYLPISKLTSFSISGGEKKKSNNFSKPPARAPPPPPPTNIHSWYDDSPWSPWLARELCSGENHPPSNHARCCSWAAAWRERKSFKLLLLLMPYIILFTYNMPESFRLVSIWSAWTGRAGPTRQALPLCRSTDNF